MKNIIPVALFAFLVLLFPHGVFENIAMVGVMVTGGMALWRAFRPKKVATCREIGWHDWHNNVCLRCGEKADGTRG